MASKSFPDCNIVLGQSWDTVDLPEDIDDDDLRESRADFEQNPNRHLLGFDDADTPRPPGIPVEFMCIFGSYPMEDGFSLAVCKFCGTRIKTECMDMHISACTDIPDDERQILAEFENSPGSLVELSASSIPGLSNVKTHRYGHVPAPKTQVQVPKISGNVGTASSSRSPQIHTQGTSTLTSKPKPQIQVGEKDLKDVKPLIEKPNTPPSATAIMKSKLSSQAAGGNDLKPGSPSSTEFQKPKAQKTVTGELKAPVSPSSSMMPKLKPSLILKISATTPVGSPEGQPQPGSKGKTYSVSHSSVAADGIESESLPPSPDPATSSGSGSLGITPPATPVPTKASLKAMDNVDRDAPAKKKKKKKSKNEPRKVIPLKERSFNPNEHCGVANADGTQCKRSLTCKTHSMALRRAVPSRSQPFDTLLASHKKARDEAKLVKQGEDLMTVKEILHNSLIGQDGPGSPGAESPVLDFGVHIPNVGDNSRGRPILTSLLANCSPTNVSKSRSHVVSPRQHRDTQSPHKASPDARKKNKSFKYKKEDSDSIGIDLYQLEKASGFVRIDGIIPPDDEVENRNMQTVDTLYRHTSSLFRDTLGHYSDEECEIMPSAMQEIELPRNKKYQPTRQLLAFQKYCPIPGVAEINVSEASNPASVSRCQVYLRHGESAEPEYRLGGVKRTRSGDSDASTYSSSKRKPPEHLSGFAAYEQHSDFQSSHYVAQCTDKIKLRESVRHDPTVHGSTQFPYPIKTERDKGMGPVENVCGEEVNNETPTQFLNTDGNSPGGKVTFKLHGKRVFRPTSSSPKKVSTVLDSKLIRSMKREACVEIHQGEEEREGNLVPVHKVTHTHPSGTNQIRFQNVSAEESTQKKLEPMLDQRQNISPKVVESPVPRSPMQMPSLISPQKTIITFHNVGGAIAQVTSHNPGTVHYRTSEDTRDQQGTWASLLEQVRVGIEQGRSEDAPVADSELSKLLAAQFED